MTNSMVERGTTLPLLHFLQRWLETGNAERDAQTLKIGI